MFDDENEQNAPQNFDEANQAAINMFNAGEPAPPDNLPPEEPPIDGNPPSAEQPGAMPPEQPPVQQPPPEVILQQAFAKNQALKQQIQQLQQAMAQQNDVQKQNIVEDALQMPTLDFASLAYDDEATARGKQEKYMQDMAKYMQSTMLKELSPFLEQAREGAAQKEKAEVIAALSALPELQDFNSMIPQLDNIIAKNKALSAPGVPLDEKYLSAYLMAVGLNSRKNKSEEMNPDKFMQFYNSNPEIKDLIDKQRLAEIKGAQDIPQFSASNGAVNAALSMPQTPETFDEAYELSRKYLG